MQPIQLPLVSGQVQVKKSESSTATPAVSFRNTLANAKKQQNAQAKEVPLGTQRAPEGASTKVKAASTGQSESTVADKSPTFDAEADTANDNLSPNLDVNTQALDMLSLVGSINLHLSKTEVSAQSAAQSQTVDADSVPLALDTEALLVPQNFIDTSIEAARGGSATTALPSIKDELPIEVDTTKAGADAIQDKPTAEFAQSLQATVLTQQPLATEAAKHMNAVIAPRVGNPGWNQAIGQRVLWMVSDSIQSATLTLNPPDLGPVQVVLSVENDQANASFNTANPEVQQALESALPKLRDMMENAGIKFGDATVSLGFSQQQSQQGKGDTTQPTSQTESSWNALVAEPEASIEPTARIVQGSGLINTFA